MNQEQSNIFQY